jgi:hypothetical protein
MEDFAIWALNRTLRGIFPLGAYEDMGFDRADIEEIRQLRRPAGGDETAFPNSSYATSIPDSSARCARSGC